MFRDFFIKINYVCHYIKEEKINTIYLTNI
jgi:hypothetical protein